MGRSVEGAGGIRVRQALCGRHWRRKEVCLDSWGLKLDRAFVGREMHFHHANVGTMVDKTGYFTLILGCRVHRGIDGIIVRHARSFVRVTPLEVKNCTKIKTMLLPSNIQILQII